MCCLPSCSVMQAIWYAAIAGQSSPAVRPAGDNWGGTLGTSPWRRWRARWCSRVSTAAGDVLRSCYTQTRWVRGEEAASSNCLVVQLEHEETCEYRPYSCPCPGASCKWQGSLEQVMAHLMQVHKSITTLQGEDIVFLATDINLPGRGCNVTLL